MKVMEKELKQIEKILDSIDTSNLCTEDLYFLDEVVSEFFVKVLKSMTKVVNKKIPTRS